MINFIKKRTFAIIEKIDEELETLTNDFFDRRDDSITLLQKIGVIRGLLVDINI
ncbi:DUF327 family protein [Bacillus carboniphilus]|uniref:DUF327 family protein n=1 Tax=Bacillus carboniphilus TaxID=86663 RepID=UPI003532315E